MGTWKDCAYNCVVSVCTCVTICFVAFQLRGCDHDLQEHKLEQLKLEYEMRTNLPGK